MTTMQATFGRMLPGLAVMVAWAALAPAASASINPVTVTLDQSAGTSAGSTANLGMDIKFTPGSSDSPKDLGLSLPAGLLANASINGGACLKSATPTSACQVGTGTVTATENVLIPAPLSLQATFDLVKPPMAGDLAGLVILVNGSQLGSPADITVRPGSSPAGVGLSIAFTGIPDTYPVAGISVPISVDRINSTFNGLRYPDSCPSTPANVIVTADSYGDSTVRTATAPLTVTGCSSLAYAPKFAARVVKDRSDSFVQVATDITQTATEATSKSVSLAFPSSVLAPNLGVVGALCANPSSGTCTPIGSASSTSPLYPTPLVGKAYLTGAVLSPAITLVFPAPFSLTLTGAVDLGTNSTTFSGLPDIPLTDLNVTLNGGKQSVFESPCTPPAGTATATLTTQNGDRTISVPAPFTVSGCPASAGGGGTTTAPPTTTTTSTGKRGGRPRITAASLSGLGTGKPALFFQLVAGKNAKLKSFAVKLPRGLSFVGRKVHKQLRVSGVKVTGGKVRSIVLLHGRLVVTLRSPVSSLSVSISHRALRESAALKSKARHGTIKRLKVAIITTDAARTSVTLTLVVNSVRRRRS